MIRAFNPQPGAFTYLHNDMIKLWQADIVVNPDPARAGEIITADDTRLIIACGQDALSVNILQKAGSKKLTAAQFLAGHTIQPGDRLSMST